jgi:hypothetical protein
MGYESHPDSYLSQIIPFAHLTAVELQIQLDSYFGSLP